MHPTAPKRTRMHQNAPNRTNCTEAHQNAPECTEAHQTPPKPPERAVMQQNGGSPETSVPLRFVDFVRSPKNRACRYDSGSLCRGIPLSPGPSIPVRSGVSCDRRNTSVPVRFAVRRDQSPSIFRSGAGGVQAGTGVPPISPLLPHPLAKSPIPSTHPSDHMRTWQRPALRSPAICRLRF